MSVPVHLDFFHVYVINLAFFLGGPRKKSRFPEIFLSTLFKTEELFLINYPVLLTPDLGCIYYEY